MKNIIINTIDEYLQVIADTQFGRIFSDYQEIYRGQSKNSYDLRPSLARDRTIDVIENLEKNIITTFKKKIENSPNLKKYIQLSISEVDSHENEWRWLEQVQHYRLPTRLLDWALDPNIALYFACEKNPNDIGQFWIFKSPLTWECDDFFMNDPYSICKTQICNSSYYNENDYEYKIAQQRKGFQSGKFTIQDYSKCIIPLEQQEEFNSRLIKYLIPSDKKVYFLNYLKTKNITNDTIYIKYDETIENLVSEIKRQYNI